MKVVLLASVAALLATGALADERILSSRLPAWCGGQQSSGACIRGAKDYRLVNGRVVWVLDTRSPRENKDFWHDQDKYNGGANEATPAQ